MKSNAAQVKYITKLSIIPWTKNTCSFHSQFTRRLSQFKKTEGNSEKITRTNRIFLKLQRNFNPGGGGGGGGGHMSKF